LRSLLFVPADSARKLDKAFRSRADALILDLEDSVAPAAKEVARRTALGFLREHRAVAERPQLYVRINALTTPHADGDLDVVMTAAPDGIVLPKATGGADVALLGAKLAVREALHGVEDGRTRIIALASETASAVFGLGTYRGASARLAGLTWGAEDLSAETGALLTRVDGDWTEPIRIVRSLALFAAAAAGVAAIDAVYTALRDDEGLRRECAAARRDGFSAKLAIHPAQVEAINEAFALSAEAIAQAEAVVAAFAAAGNPGVTSLDGKMLDIPHLKAARRLLAEAGRLSPAPDAAATSEPPPKAEPAALPEPAPEAAVEAGAAVEADAAAEAGATVETGDAANARPDPAEAPSQPGESEY
jgi:citrate lyase subunit beta / citryl-CoA lyase